MSHAHAAGAAAGARLHIDIIDFSLVSIYTIQLYICK